MLRYLQKDPKKKKNIRRKHKIPKKNLKQKQKQNTENLYRITKPSTGTKEAQS